MSALAAGSPSMARPKSLEDSAVPSGNAMVLAALVGLNERIADLALEKHADELVAAIAGDLSQRPSAHTYALRANEIFHNGGNGPIWYAARGAVRISTRRDQDIVIFELAIKEGWHIQAHQPLQKDLVGTTLAVAEPGTKWRLRNVSYPEPVIKSLSFRGEGLALYESNVRIGTRISASEQQDSGMLRLMLTLQACNDRVCLPPDRVALNFRVGER